MFYFTYKTTNTINGKYYIGVHKTHSINDGYLGSGTVLKKAIGKYGKSNFKREILKFHSSSKEMYSHEKDIVNDSLIKRSDTYNIKLGGHGGFDYVNSTNTEEYIAKRNKAASKAFQEKLKDPEFYKFWYSRMMEGRSKAKQKGQYL